MKKLPIQELIEWLNTTTKNTSPYKPSQMVYAVQDAAAKQDKKSLEELSDAMVTAYIRVNPNENEEIMNRNARENLATLAYLADHEPASPEEFMKLEPVDAYKQPNKYGPAMKLVKEIYEKKQIDIIKYIQRR